MTTDYLKLAREARARAMDSLQTAQKMTRFVAFPPGDVPALCDAIEAQAAEIERLKKRLDYAKCVAIGRIAGDLRSE